MKTKVQKETLIYLAGSEAQSQRRIGSYKTSINSSQLTLKIMVSDTLWARSLESSNSQSPRVNLICAAGAPSIGTNTHFLVSVCSLSCFCVTFLLPFNYLLASSRRMRNHSSLVKQRRTKKERANHSATNSWADCYMIEK